MNAAPQANCHAASSSAITGSLCDPYWSFLCSWTHSWTVNTQVKLNHCRDFSSLCVFFQNKNRLQLMERWQDFKINLLSLLVWSQVWKKVWNCTSRSTTHLKNLCLECFCCGADMSVTHVHMNCPAIIGLNSNNIIWVCRHFPIPIKVLQLRFHWDRRASILHVTSAPSHVILGHGHVFFFFFKNPVLTHDFGLPRQRQSKPERILGRRDEWKHNPHFHHCAWPPPTAAAWIPPFMGAAQWDLHSFLLILPPIIPSSLHTLAARTRAHARARAPLSASSNVDA